MKKSLSLILALAMVFSMFASVAFAAETTTTPKTTEEKYAELEKLGIFEGDGTGANLQGEMDRAQLAKIVAKLQNLKEDPAANTYSDVPADHWAAGFIGAVTKAGIFDGVAEGKFDPAGKVTLEQLAKVLVVATGLDESTDAVTGVVSDWAKGYVAAAVKAFGLSQADYTINAIRGVFVELTYAALDNLTPAVGSVDAKIVGAKKIQVTFDAAVDTAKATFSVKKGSIPINVAKTSFDDAKKVATIELASKVTAGDYSLTVGGVVSPEVTKTFTVEDEKVAKIEFLSDKASLHRAGTSGTDDPKVVTFAIKVTNQYGEDITEQTYNAGELQVTSGNGNVNAVNTKGTYSVTSSADFLLESKVAVSAVHAKTGTFASAVLTVASKPQVHSVTFTKLYTTETINKELTVNSTASNFYIVVDAKDQYGNAIAADVTGAAWLNADLITNPANETIVKVGPYTTQSVDGTTKLVLPLVAPSAGLKAGTTQILAISKWSGGNASFEVKVTDKAKVDSFTLSAPELAVGGKDIEIPFTAIDQFGATMTNAADIKAGLTSFTVTEGTYDFVQDYVKGTPKLLLKGVSASSNKQVFINAVTSTGKTAQLNLTVVPNAKPIVVTALPKAVTTLAVNGVTTVKPGEITVLDQYNRSYNVKDESVLGTAENNYRVSLKTSDKGKVAFTSDLTVDTVYIASGTTEPQLKGLAKGTATLTVKLQQFKKVTRNGVDSIEWVDVPNSEYTTTFTVVEKADITGYEVADIAKVYANYVAGTTETHGKDVKVSGLLANGTKVALPTDDATYYSATVVGSTYLAYTGGKVYAEPTINLGGTDKEKTFQVVVTAQTKDTTQTIIKDFVVSNVAPVADSFEYNATVSGTFTKESDGVISITETVVHGMNERSVIEAAVKVKDQYGVAIATPNGFKTVVGSNYPVENNVAKTISTIKAGQSFNITGITDTGKTVTVKVIVK